MTECVSVDLIMCLCTLIVGMNVCFITLYFSVSVSLVVFCFFFFVEIKNFFFIAVCMSSSYYFLTDRKPKKKKKYENIVYVYVATETHTLNVPYSVSGVYTM